MRIVEQKAVELNIAEDECCGEAVEFRDCRLTLEGNRLGGGEVTKRTFPARDWM
jgi:hypothetical protein